MPIVDRIRGIFQPPVLIFIALLVGTIIASFSVVYITIVPNLRGEYIMLDTFYMQLEYPRNWYGFTWDDYNETRGTVYGGLFGSPQEFSMILINIYDVKATQNYKIENNIWDIPSILLFEANNMYKWSLSEHNENATIHSIENGTLSLSNNQAEYMIFFIREGYKEEELFYNITGTFVAFIDNQELVHITFWGKDKDHEQNLIFFDSLLDSMLVKNI